MLPETLAPGVTVSATAPDGLIEGFEAPAYRWVVGVQWHPEREEMAEASRGLFEQFVAACAPAPAPA